jgi:zinc protease
MRYTTLILIIFVLSAFITPANQKVNLNNCQPAPLIITNSENYPSILKFFEDEVNPDNLKIDFDSTEFIQSNPDSLFKDSINNAYAKEILKKYFMAIGGEEQIRNVNDRATDVKGIVEGVQTEIVFYQKAPNKLCQKIMVDEVEQKIIFDGVKGIKSIDGMSQDITGNELIKLSFDAIMNLILEPESYNAKLQYKGLEIINERDAYKIMLTLPNNAEWLQYYDMETGLKIRESKDIITPQGKYQQITEFDDYRDVEGIRYPFKIKQYLGNQTLDFTVESIQVNTGISDEIFLTD